jgi:hypothetical protein
MCHLFFGPPNSPPKRVVYFLQTRLILKLFEVFVSMIKVKKIVGFLISLVSVLAINFIPLEMWLYRDFSSESAMIFYALENIIAIALAAVFVLLFAPVEEVNPDYHRKAEILKEHPAFEVVSIRRKKDILTQYLVFSVAFSIGAIIFMLVFIFLILKTQIQFAAVTTALWWILGFQILEFFGDFLMLRPLTLAQTEVFLKRSMGRVALLFLSVFIGIFLAFWVQKWFVIPFIALKTMADIGEQVQIFKGLRIK